MDKTVHPCRDKSFRKAVSAVMDDLRMDSVNIDNINLIVKLAKQRVLRMLPRGSEGVVLLSRFS